MSEDLGGVEVLFYGDGNRKGENPRDFIKKMERMFMKKIFSDSERIKYFQLSLKDGAHAEDWFNNLAKEHTVTWDSLIKAFDKEWPPRKTVRKTREEKQAMLEEATISEAELGTQTTTEGIEEHAHIAWANKVEKLANAIPDRDNILVPSFRKKLPPTLKALVDSKHNTWSTFCKAIRDIPSADMLEKKEEVAQRQRMEEELSALKRQQPQTPSKALGAALRNVSLASPSIPPTYRLPQTTTSSVRTGQRIPGTTPFTPRSDAEKLAIIERIPQPPPNTPAGHAEYKTQIAAWNTAHAGTMPNESRPYPLTPGTCPVASRDCWNCGMQGHSGSACPETERVPELEFQWRRKATMIKRGASPREHNINYVANPFTMPQEEYNRQVIENFLAQQNQGNGVEPSE